MNPTLQRWGAAAAAFQMLAYVAGFAVMLTVFAPLSGMSGPAKLDFLLARQTLFTAWNTVIYVLFGVALVVLAVALHERLRALGGALMQVATSFALIWAGLVIAAGMVANVGLGVAGAGHAADPTQAATLFAATAAIQEAIGGGIELVGGLWVLLVSVAGLRARSLPRGLHWLGVLTGAAGIVTLVPALKEFGAVFGIGQIVWFGWLAMVLPRRATDRC